MRAFAIWRFRMGRIEYRLRSTGSRVCVESRYSQRRQPPTPWEAWNRTFDTPQAAMAEVLLKYRGATRPVTGEARRILNPTATKKP